MMISYRFAPRVTKGFFLMLPLFVLAACKKPKPEMSMQKKPAELTLPTQGLQGSDELEKALAKFDWGPAHDAPCPGCKNPGDVTIRYTGKTKDIRAGDGPANLRIVALIQNYSDQDVAHTPSQTTFKAKTKYLMWVHRRADKKATWGFIELGDDYNPTLRVIGLLKHCGDEKSKTDDANFKNCGHLSTSKGLIKSAHASTNMAAEITKPGWVACDPDCCTGTTQQQ